MSSNEDSSGYSRCSYNNWYELFESFIQPNVILQVPDDVLLYFMSDIMVLPKNSMLHHRNSSTNNGFWSDAEDELEEPNFSEFDEKLKEAIKRLGGKVFIKLNWSAPKDASWITSTRSLCCSDPGDIYLLLKSSSYISNDLSLLRQLSNKTPCCLILKKWEEVHPGTEFRCFVMNKNLVGISQRDVMSYFKYIEDSKSCIVKLITDFFLNHVKSKFNLNSYTFDVIVTPGKNIILVDFGLLNRDTECLMFSWKELESKGKVCCHESTVKHPPLTEEPTAGIVAASNDTEFKCSEPEFRFIDEHTKVTKNHCKHYGIPVDVAHFCSEKKTVTDFIREEILNHNS